MESNDSPEIPDRGETSDIPGLPSGDRRRREEIVKWIQMAALRFQTGGGRHRTSPASLRGPAKQSALLEGMSIVNKMEGQRKSVADLTGRQRVRPCRSAYCSSAVSSSAFYSATSVLRLLLALWSGGDGVRVSGLLACHGIRTHTHLLFGWSVHTLWTVGIVRIWI